MNQIVTLIITILFCLVGGLSTLYLLVGIPGVIAYKIVRCVKDHKSLYD